MVEKGVDVFLWILYYERVYRYGAIIQNNNWSAFKLFIAADFTFWSIVL